MEINKNSINEAITRGVETIYPSHADFEKLLLSGKRLKIYCGFDPSAPSLHIGNAILLNKLAQFQALGHEIIFLIGDFTGMIGDPTDKTATRKKLTREETRANSQNYQKQASGYLKFHGENAAQVAYNSRWSDKLTFRDLIELSSHFTVQQMLQRDMFQKRLAEEKPIHLHEFLYPLSQGYDSVALDVDLEIGGNDQMFNMMCGRDLMKSLGKKEKFVMTLKLLTDDKGKKMGKSEGNMVNLDETPENMYGKIMAWPDNILENAFELCTRVPLNEITKIKDALKTGANPRDFKMRLALEITNINHGEAAARAAQDFFIKTVQKKEMPDEVEIIKLEDEKMNIVDILVKTKLASSKGEARRLIEQGGVRVEGEVVSDVGKEIELNKEGVLVQRGKRFFARAVRA